MGDGKPPAGKPIMAAQTIEERLDAVAEVGRLGGELIDRFPEAMGDLDVPAGEPAAELLIVIALHDMSLPGIYGGHDNAQHVGRARAAVDEVADKDELATLGGTISIVVPSCRRP